MINLAHIAELEGDYHRAVQQYQKAIESDPQAVHPRFCLAVLYDQHDMFEEAMNEYQGVLERDPHHVKALFNTGNLYAQLGDYTNAIQFFEKVLTLDQDNAEVWNNLGSLFEERKDYHKAISAYQQSLSINHFQEKAHVNLARLQYLHPRLNSDHFDKADVIRRLNFVLSMNPRNKTAQEILRQLTGGKIHED